MEMFLESKEYKKVKTEYEKYYFKLFGKYCWYDDDKLVEKSAGEMAEYFKNKKVKIEYVEQETTKKGTTISTSKTLIKNFYQIWSEDPDMREYQEVIFNCNLKNVKKNQFNLFSGFNHLEHIKYDKIDLEPVFEHIKSLVNYDNELFKYYINWLAQLVQNPHILPHTCIIFISDEGVGKDLHAEFISNVINPKYCHNTEKLELVCGKFNSILGGKLLMVINETNPVDSRERIENIKFLTTASKITIEGKHKDPIKSDNFARFIFFSNRLFAFPVEEGARRPVIINSSSKYLKDNIGIEKNKIYFDNLYKIYNDNKYQKAFLEYLLKLDITDFNPKDFKKSELHSVLEENSISPIVGYLASIIQIKDKRTEIKQLTTETLNTFNIYMKENNFKFDYSQNKFNVELESKYKIKKVKSNGKMYFIFNIPELKELLITKYKYSFDKVEEIEQNEKSSLDDGLEDEIDYKKLYFELLEKSNPKPKLTEDELLELELLEKLK